MQGLFMISLTSIVFFLTPHYMKTCLYAHHTTHHRPWNAHTLIILHAFFSRARRISDIKPGAEELINAEFRRWNCPEVR
jgi:hypothetical protein